MVLQTVEMMALTEKLESQTEEYIRFAEIYEAKKAELIEDLKSDNIDRLQEYDLMIFKCALQDKKEAMNQIKITREEIKQRALYEKSESLPKNSKEYYETSIEYWEQVHVVYSLKNSEYAAKKYRQVVDHQIWMAEQRLAEVSA